MLYANCTDGWTEYHIIGLCPPMSDILSHLLLHQVFVNLETMGEVLHHDGTFLSITCKKKFPKKKTIKPRQIRIDETFKAI